MNFDRGLLRHAQEQDPVISPVLNCIRTNQWYRVRDWSGHDSRAVLMRERKRWFLDEHGILYRKTATFLTAGVAQKVPWLGLQRVA